MRDGFRIIDGDRHVIEPIGLWRDYLDPEFRDHAPYYQEVRSTGAENSRTGDRLPPQMFVDGEPLMNLPDSAYRAVAAAAAPRAATLMAAQEPAGHIAAMDHSGIEAAALFPTYGSYLVSIDNMAPALSCAYARAYNDWLRDFCRAAPGRFLGVGLLSRHDPAQMVDEARRIALFGWTAVVIRPNPVRGRSLGHPDYEPFWQACEELSLAVAVHEGTHARVPAAGADRFDSRFGMHACSHPLEQMMAYLSLLESGVLERHPRLQVAFLEAGAGWMPHWLWRLDEVEYRYLHAEVAGRVCMKPSEYFRRQCMVGFEPGEPLLPEVIARLGEDKLVFGTDFPHLDHDEDIVERLLASCRALPEQTVRRLLWDNAAQFYRLDAPL